MDVLSSRGSAGHSPGHSPQPRGIRTGGAIPDRAGRGYSDPPALIGGMASRSAMSGIRFDRVASIRRQVIAATYETSWKAALAVETMLRRNAMLKY